VGGCPEFFQDIPLFLPHTVSTHPLAILLHPDDFKKITTAYIQPPISKLEEGFSISNHDRATLEQENKPADAFDCASDGTGPGRMPGGRHPGTG
jgi:hypothetical protein